MLYKQILIICMFSLFLGASSTWQEVSSTSAITMAQTIHAAPSKGSPQDSDELGIADSNASFLFKKINIVSLKTFLFGSPVLTGTPTAPTAVNGTNNTQIATTAYVMSNSGSGVGVGQSWQNVIGSRTLGTTYTNDTGKPIQLNVQVWGYYFTLFINGINMGEIGTAAGDSKNYITTIIPNGSAYSISFSGSYGGLQKWAELR